VYTGSIPVLASNKIKDLADRRRAKGGCFHIRFHVSRFVFVLFRVGLGRPASSNGPDRNRLGDR